MTEQNAAIIPIDPHANRDWSHPGSPDLATGEWGSRGLSDPMHNDDIGTVVDANSFDYTITDVSRLKATSREVEDNTGLKKWRITGLEIDGKEFKPTDRFMTSLMAKFGFGRSVLTYWSPEELFERIDLRHPRTDLRLTTYRDTVLAVSDPAKAIMDASTFAQTLGMSEIGGPLSLTWDGTQFVSIHDVPEHPFDVMGDTFEPRFVLFTPIDGYGKPAAYLTVMRHRCLNALMAYAKPFRSEVQLGKGEPAEPFLRFLDSFNNEEGFATVRQRLEAAYTTAASVYEAGQFRKAITRGLRAANDDQTMLSIAHTKLYSAYSDTVGDISAMLQTGSESWIPEQRQRQINVKCTVADLLCLATELLSHHGRILDNPKALYDWAGSMTVRLPFDLEGIDIADFDEIEVRDERSDLYLPQDLSAKAA